MKNVLLFAICAIATLFIGCNSFKPHPLDSAFDRLEESCKTGGLVAGTIACTKLEGLRGVKASREVILERIDAGKCVSALVFQGYLTAAIAYCETSDEKDRIREEVKDAKLCGGN